MLLLEKLYENRPAFNKFKPPKASLAVEFFMLFVSGFESGCVGAFARFPFPRLPLSDQPDQPPRRPCGEVIVKLPSAAAKFNRRGLGVAAAVAVGPRGRGKSHVIMYVFLFWFRFLSTPSPLGPGGLQLHLKGKIGPAGVVFGEGMACPAARRGIQIAVFARPAAPAAPSPHSIVKHNLRGGPGRRGVAWRPHLVLGLLLLLAGGLASLAPR